MTDESTNGDGAVVGGGHDRSVHSHGGAGTPGTAEFWEDFYRDRGPWTGNANAALVTELADRPLSAGTGLDVACGTGGDAIWLASQGWTVTGVDISDAALAQAEAQAEIAGLAGRIHWQQADLETDFPEGAWDLVNVAYLHSPVALTRELILNRAAAAVAPGGTMVIIGHQGAPHWTALSETQPTNLPSVDEVLEVLDLDGWTVAHSGDISVSRRTPEGELVTRVDNIIRLQRALG